MPVKCIRLTENVKAVGHLFMSSNDKLSISSRFRNLLATCCRYQTRKIPSNTCDLKKETDFCLFDFPSFPFNL